MAGRKRLWSEELFRFGFESLGVNRARSWIRRANLPRDLLVERHAGHKMRRVRRRIKGRGLPRPGRHKGRPNTGDPSAEDQTIAVWERENRRPKKQNVPTELEHTSYKDKSSHLGVLSRAILR